MTDHRSFTDTTEAWPSEDTVWDAIRLTFDEKTAARLSFKRWKDGIDVDYPSSAAMLFAKQMFAEGVASAAQGSQEPVAYRVKDFADGWILCHTLEVAEHEADGQCLIQPLYAGAIPFSRDVAYARQDQHDAIYLRGWNEGIERAAELLDAEGSGTPAEKIRTLLEPSSVSSTDREGSK